ncbi:MAG TPA: penicillin-binding transpeptidase domain-containing protein [Candidatus Woesebacteria bacterium]|nr:penicillin-binding transpeptidase domain-containing protein [Candidatus Woesebacteria bacterium]
MKWLINLGVIASFLFLLAVGIRLAIIRHGFYSSLARDNKVAEIKIPAARGQILDRKGRVVVESEYQYFEENEDKVASKSGKYKGDEFEGKTARVELKRKYLYGETMGLVTGYVGRVSENDLKSDRCGRKLDGFDVVGRMGVEESLDCLLRGTEGKRLVEVDAKGKYVRELGRQEPVAGQNLELSIDAFWQEKIYQMIKDKKAAVVMSRPDSGKIIALVSSPSIDPNVFSYEIDNQKINDYLKDRESLPLLNRTITGRYHPGSVFKITVATAGLESGVMGANDLIEDTGVIKIGEYSFANWLWNKRGGTDGMVDMVKALKRSNDIYFYRLGEKLGIDRIKEWANKFGYGSKTGVELGGEIEGIVPDDQWKQDNKGERWFLGNTYHVSIGQGDLGVTPLQVNQMTNIIANDGKKCKMSLLKNSKSECVDLKINKNTIETVTNGMKEACKTGGTAWPLFNFKTELACKTGTAEVGDGSKDTHAWLTAFAPADNPEISITVLVERGGEGSDVAAPIVGDILKEWFSEPDTLVPRYKE